MGSVVRRASVGVQGSGVEAVVVREVIASPVPLVHGGSSCRIPVHSRTGRRLMVHRIFWVPIRPAGS